MKDNYVADGAVGTYSQDLNDMKNAIDDLIVVISEIKSLLFKVHGVKEDVDVEEKAYPWHFPNVTTTAEYHEEEWCKEKNGDY